MVIQRPKKGENSPSKSKVVASYKVGPCYKWTDMGPPISKVISPTSFFQVTFWWFKLRSLKRSRKPSQKKLVTRKNLGSYPFIYKAIGSGSPELEHGTLEKNWTNPVDPCDCDIYLYALYMNGWNRLKIGKCIILTWILWFLDCFFFFWWGGVKIEIAATSCWDAFG